jgi:hypothetical protein
MDPRLINVRFAPRPNSSQISRHSKSGSAHIKKNAVTLLVTLTPQELHSLKTAYVLRSR